MTQQPRSVLVVGAGAIGLAAAYHLAKRGLDVHVLDAGEPGKGASWGNGGWISPVLSGPTPGPGIPRVGLTDTFRSDAAVSLRPDRSPSLLLWMAQFARHCTRPAWERGTRRLAALSQHMLASYGELSRLGIDVSLQQAGNLRACPSPEAARQELAALSLMKEYGFDVPDDILDADRLHALEPALTEYARAGFLLPSEMHVDPGVFTSALAEYLRSRGVQITTGAQVKRLTVRDGRVRQVVTSQGSFETDSVLVAGGLQSRELLRPLRIRLPLRGGKGYSFFVATEQAPRRPMYLSTTKVGVTPLEGGYRVVGGLEFGAEDLSINQSMVDAMIAVTRRYVTWPAHTPPQQVWAGLRPMTPDGLPIMDRIPDVTNTYVSTGHGMLGVGYAMTCGDLMADFIAESRKRPVLDPMSLVRFGS
ncbi:D-amino-acid dehydrogenase [Mycolicibacterium litorale]|uniref:D-amino-acid dehydrogenase n=1 Tax=Mycolicibacterium litorale TaxID=758802 RepID=A0A6S6P8D0_9MYCO|nr:FAD-dependent oxidoreductase [Mycolicibacterium litorale]BCI54775.1 D-amino-acid dehydrogenase [Mycolicibacterium litorale]